MKFLRRFGVLLWSFGAVFYLFGSNIAAAQDIRVFAAASLKTALDHVVEDYSLTSGQHVIVSYGGSSALARQISFGAPADIFISANASWMNELTTGGYVQAGSRIDLLSNKLVLISTPSEPPLADLLQLPNRLKAGRLAMAQVDAVPAGVYGKSALEYFGLWASVAKRVAQTDNVRAALSLVASHAAPFGIVYATDAAADPRVAIVYSFPEQSHPQVIYPAAIIDGQSSPNVDAFLAYLSSSSARDRFVEQGFLPLTQAP